MSNSANFFGVLDDSDDEGGPAVPVAAVTTSAPALVATNKKKVAPKAVVEPSIPDERKRPNNSDRNTKFGRGGRAPPRDGKRAYERRSGTGRGKEIKKDGAGARNWGSDKNDARDAEHNAPTTNEEEEEPVGGGDAEEEDAGGDDVAATATETQQTERVPEPVDNTMSYEEYMKAKAAAESSSSGLLAPVKEREVVDEFANMKPAVVQEEDFLVMGGAKTKRKKEAKPQKTATELMAGLRVASGGGESSNDGGRGRGGRDGRGRGRDGGGRGRDGGREGGGGGRGRDGGGRGRDGGRGGGRGEGGRGGREGGRGRGRGREGGREGGRGRGGGAATGRGGGINVQDETAFPSL